MDAPTLTTALKVGKRMGGGIRLSRINFACRNAVAEHFHHVSKGHFNGTVAFFHRMNIYPIFKVVAVSALVVKPRTRVAHSFSFSLVGASCAKIVLCSGKKFGWCVFREVVEEPLKADTGAKAVTDHGVAVLGDGVKMAEGMHRDSFRDGYSSTIIIYAFALFFKGIFHSFDKSIPFFAFSS